MKKSMVDITMSDLLSQEAIYKPFILYDRLRQKEALSSVTDFLGMGHVWIVTTYDDVNMILKDARFIRDRRKLFPAQDAQGLSQESLSVNRFLRWRRDLLMVDPPDHTRLRRLVSKAFTPRMIEQLRPRIQEIADDLLDKVQTQGTMDLIKDFASPLPITVISEMLGIPVQERAPFRDWTQTLLAALTDPGLEAQSGTTQEAFVRFIKTLLAQKREYPGSDLISGLVRAEEDGETLNENELISMIWLLIVAGHETTVNLIGSGVLALLEHSEQMRSLQLDPLLLPSAIEELLRYVAPVMYVGRFAGEDVLLHDRVIRKGEQVIIPLIAANTDPRSFSDPATLDLTRQEHDHLAFGKGIHYCLGAPLARLEGQIAIGTLLRRLPLLRLACQPEQLRWRHMPFLRGLIALPVMF
jgi:cytochrome P450